ncbi:hypothetical protein FVEG_11604 [Fusarium verticillioides 7600]|uniref:Hypervirulence associated protein TUDOR domain-containing protein n=1 Tax=Gibberella moniliformis (strain M3125 / FGSC 7600) TaxID=334819 RepID=W7MPW0_GIBM7|nr:hypothetical protein FVEG_11604 [Fusarium verticillioides 7600]EWG53111.1 hypothetical protein FVEG_11604 [Fusarium verticillioides 7600]RBQ65967.1 hypothetical protein FVER14953_11604 [Fusarium verticillioides]RBR07107.1 hypothetical protein FVER53590_11604 [Fusarium verticillioides]
MKGNDEVIQEFNEVVNMTASELEKWLKSDDSNSAGWPKEDENGETVGHDSGRKIVEILKENPKKEPEKYTDEQVEHMRKVVSYCKRHLAQEAKANNDKSPEEVKKTKSYASLKNWGHDFLKAQGKENGSEKKEEKEEKGEEKQEENDDAEEAEDEEGDGDDKQTGEKRRATRSQTGSNKKRETRKGESTKSNDEEEEEEDEDEEDGEKKQSNGQSKKSNGSSKKEEEAEEEQDDDEGGDDSGAKKGPKKGETVSWNWGQGQPEGKVLDVKAEDTTITTKNGNEVSRKGDEEDPAVVLDTGKNKAIKKAHELN